MEVWPQFLEISTEEDVWIVPDIGPYILLREDPVGFDFEISSIFIADCGFVHFDESIQGQQESEQNQLHEKSSQKSQWIRRRDGS